MADTILGWMPDKKCDDCGELGISYRHWGDLAPAGPEGSEKPVIFLCKFCWGQRYERRERGEKIPLAAGVKPPGVPEEFLNKAIRIKTESGSIYEFSVPDKEGVRTVSNVARQINYTKCKILFAALKKNMWIRVVDDPEKDSSHLVCTTLVKSIEVLS